MPKAKFHNIVLIQLRRAIGELELSANNNENFFMCLGEKEIEFTQNELDEQISLSEDEQGTLRNILLNQLRKGKYHFESPKFRDEDIIVNIGRQAHLFTVAEREVLCDYEHF